MTQTLPKYETVKNISHRFSLDREAVRTILGISESTQFRYEKNNPILKPTLADRLERFQRITQQAVELFEDEAEAKRWLSTPKKSLGDLSPWQALATDAGAKKVENLLYMAEYGIFG